VDYRIVLVLSFAASLVGCAASSQLITGMPRSQVSIDQVKVYTQAPPSFDEIAVLTASRSSISTAGGERAIAKMIEKLRAQAALLGANGLLLDNFSDSKPFSLGTGVGADTYTHNGSVSLGLGGSLGMIKKTTQGRAIFVPPNRDEVQPD
jgi:hypothetical protein